MVFAFVLAGRSQGVLLNPGDTWSYSFSAVDYVRSQAAPEPARFSYTVTTLTPTFTFVDFQLFEGGTNFYSGSDIFPREATATGGIGLMWPTWQSLSGAVTFSASDRISLDSMTFEISRPGTIISLPFGDLVTSWDVFQTTVTLTPEPTTASLLALAAVSFGFFRFVVRRPSPPPNWLTEDH